MSWSAFGHYIFLYVLIPVGIILLTIVLSTIIGKIINSGPPKDISGTTSDSPYNSGPSYNDRVFDRAFERSEKVKDTIRRERAYLSDDEIRSRHEVSWGHQETDKAFKDIDKHSFIGWLFWD